MGDFALFLFPKMWEAQEFELHPHRFEISIIDTLKPTDNRIYNNLEYSGKLQTENPQSVEVFTLHLNDAFVETTYNQQDGSFTIKDVAFGARLFTECYGYVQLKVSFSLGGVSNNLETDYIPVMVRKGLQNESVRRMTEYVYRHNEGLLFSGTPMPKDTSPLKDSARKTIESKLRLLHEISRVFEVNYTYFKINSRFTTTQAAYVDRFEKLQYISSQTVQYISGHPDELKRTFSTAGIKVGKYGYQPERTLITNNIQSYDIYENREVFGFLNTLLADIQSMQQDIQKLLSTEPQVPVESGDYVTSSYYIYASTFDALRTINVDIAELKGKYLMLLSAYSGVYQFKRNRVVSPPRPTPIFMSVPQYRQVYDCMTAWFKMGHVSLSQQTYMLSFLKVSLLYEAYVLLKLVNYLKESDYELESVNHIVYPLAPSPYYEHTKCNNLYVFKRESSTVTLYYQPVVFSADRSVRTGIGLYRNTTIPFPKWLGDNSPGGGHYLPDFLLKIEDSTRPSVKYVVADAKFSSLDTVKKYQVAASAYKYLFSISPISPEDVVSGLLIINGQSDVDEDTLTDIYNKSLSPGSISPYAEILTLTENKLINLESHTRLLVSAIGKYLSY